MSDQNPTEQSSFASPPDVDSLHTPGSGESRTPPSVSDSPSTISQPDVVVQKVQQSWQSQVMALIPILSGPALAIFGLIKGLPPWPQSIIVCVGFVVGGWLWNESKKRQSISQNNLISAASDPRRNTVAIGQPPTAG